MKKQIASVVLSVALLLGCAPWAWAEGLNNFKLTEPYHAGQFRDVSAGDWFASNVATACRLGLLKGNGDGSFNAAGNVSLAETITMAARLHSIYYNGSADFEQGTPWYEVYVSYALENGIITRTYLDYERYASRAEYAKILAAALPEEALPLLNEIEDNAIPDVPMTRSYADAVYRLYRAGVLTGYGSGGEFRPDSFVSRSEIAAIVTRMVDESQRKEFSLQKEQKSGYGATEIAALCSDAVFYIEVYDRRGDFIGSGSGFFIDSSGVAVTNQHVIEGGASAEIWLTDGSSYEVSGIYDSSEAKDLAILQIAGGGFQALEMGDSNALTAGQTVFAIGSPYGLENSISQGIISYAARQLWDEVYIQTTAPISPGSSGGALLDDSGRVIGVTCGMVDEDYAQNLNLAVPIGELASLSTESLHAFYMSHMQSLYVVRPEQSSISLSPGETAAVNIFQNYGYDGTLEYVSESYNLRVSWAEDWTDENNIPLFIRGYRRGTYRVLLNLYDENETVIASSSITVTIE